MVVMVSSDGRKWVDDYWGATKEEVVKKMLKYELKSEGRVRYYPYYMYVFVTTFRAVPPEEEKIVDAPELFSAFKGKPVKEAIEFIRKTQTQLSDKTGDPLQFVREYERKYMKKR